ncbi:MAG: hypothetical protein E6H70_02115 [Betaproteobacteria bacterium]|nr:MAG: hypothetical protein E6H70_02115 [Betaproteobacteria bacterium]
MKWLPARMPTAMGTSFRSSGLRTFDSGRTKIAQGETPWQSATMRPIPALALLIVPHTQAHWTTCSPPPSV